MKLLPRRDADGQQPDPKSPSQTPPGQFVSGQHEEDCSRFLEEVKESIRRRSEAGVGWTRRA